MGRRLKSLINLTGQHISKGHTAGLTQGKWCVTPLMGPNICENGVLLTRSWAMDIGDPLFPLFQSPTRVQPTRTGQWSNFRD